MEDSSSKIINLIHDISQLDYDIQFCTDFEGMIRLEFRKEFDDDFYEHSHLGYPGCKLVILEKAIIEKLVDFLGKAKEEANEEK